jgi:beta-fructofuranosidase
VTHRLIQHTDGTFGVAIPDGVNNKFTTNEVLQPVNDFGTTKQGDTYVLKADGSQKAFSVFDRKAEAFKIKSHIKATTSLQFGFEFGACGTRNEVFAIVFDLAKNQLRLDKVIKNGAPLNLTQLPLKVPVNKEFDVTIVSENSVCVIYINDEIAFTNRIYKMNRNPWAVFAANGEVTFSDLKIFK